MMMAATERRALYTFVQKIYNNELRKWGGEHQKRMLKQSNPEEVLLKQIDSTLADSSILNRDSKDALEKIKEQANIVVAKVNEI